MKLQRPSLTLIATVLASMILFGIGGHFVAESIIDAHEMQRLKELADIALRRSEVSVDFADASVGDIVQTGHIGCDPASLQAFRLHVYQRPSVKDVRLVTADGSVLCSAYSETLEFDKSWVDPSGMLATADPGLRLFRVEQFGGDALAVMRRIDDQKSLVVILGINSYLFDIMPADLRAHSEVLVELSNRDKLGEFSLGHVKLTNPLDVMKVSSRYPLRVTVRVDRSALAKAYGQGYWTAMLAALALGLAFGLLLGRTTKVEGPVADLDRALARKEFRPFFQPIFHLQTGEILGCEVLARWIRQDGTIVPPMKFIPLAESSGRIRAMTWQILSIALDELNAHLRQNKQFKLSFNVIPGHFLSDGFVEALRGAVAGAKVSARQIVLEITERDELNDLDKAAETVRQLRDLGFRVAIDDVGVGHSGLSHLKALGANTMKIDKFFIDTIDDESTSLIVGMLVRLAKDLQMSVVAEGIETELQIRSLLACGVEEGQGYVVAPPLPSAKFAELLEIRQTRSAQRKTPDQSALVA